MAMKDKQSVQETKIAAVQTAPTSLAPGGNFLKTKMDIELYGFLAAVGVYSDSASGTATTNAPREPSVKNANTFKMSSQDTRLGLKIKAPDLENGGKLSGQFEMDFAGTTATPYEPRLRLAFAKIDFDKWSVMAGQNWNFFAPLNPGLLNSGLGYRSGNLGTRHPQAYLENRWGDVWGGKLSTKVGVVESDTVNQENSGAPVAAAYVSYDTKVFSVPTTVGIGGLYGTAEMVGPDRTIWGETYNLTLKFTDWLALKGEGYFGAKLDGFQAGASAPLGVTSAGKTIKSKGGFVELTYNPTKKTETNFGWGLDSTGDQAIPTADASSIWDANRMFYGNVKYSLSKDLLLGLEYQNFYTHWYDGVKGTDNRVETAVIYKF